MPTEQHSVEILESGVPTVAPHGSNPQTTPVMTLPASSPVKNWAERGMTPQDALANDARKSCGK